MITKIRDDMHWRELRRKHIGASEISCLFGESPYLTPYSLYHSKKGNLPDNNDNILARFGQLMEPVIAALITEHYQWEMVKCDEYHEHPQFPWLGCTLDYYCVHPEHGPGIVQIKNVQDFAPGWTSTRAPRMVELQVQQELFVTNAARKAEGLPPFRWTAIGSMHSGNPEDIRVMFRELDTRVCDLIVKRSSQFWLDLTNGKEPPLLGSEDYDTVIDLFKAADDMTHDFIDLTGNREFEQWAKDYLRASNEELAQKKIKEEMKARILHAMMKHGPDPLRITTAHTGNVSVTVKFSSNGALRMKVLEAVTTTDQLDQFVP